MDYTSENQSDQLDFHSLKLSLQWRISDFGNYCSLTESGNLPKGDTQRSPQTQPLPEFSGEDPSDPIWWMYREY